MGWRRTRNPVDPGLGPPVSLARVQEKGHQQGASSLLCGSPLPHTQPGACVDILSSFEWEQKILTVTMIPKLGLTAQTAASKVASMFI
jgi:hypothetical protein